MKFMNPFVLVAACCIVSLFWACDDKNPVDARDFSQGKLVFVTVDSTLGTPGTYTMNLEGSELKRILGPGDVIRTLDGRQFVVPDHAGFGPPQWSPDGKRIAGGYAAAFDVSSLLVMNADGTDKHFLPLQYGSAYQPQWSPQGDRILFMRGIFLGAVVAIGVIDATGENDSDFIPAGLAPGEYVAPQVFEGDTVWIYGAAQGDYQWGPTGNKIYGIGTVGMKPDPTYVLGSRPKNEIFSFDSDTGKILNRMTRNQTDEGGFRLSPDGQHVAFLRGHGGQPNYYGQPSSFFLLSLSDGSLREIQAPAYVGPFWNWSSDSKKIVFAMDEDPDLYRNEDYHLYVVDIDRPNHLKKLTVFQTSLPDLFIPVSHLYGTKQTQCYTV